MIDSASTEPQIETRKSTFVARFFFFASLTLLLFFIVAHVTRADILVFASVFPMTLWILGGVFVSLFASRTQWQRTGLIVAWLFTGFLLGDSPQNMLRTLLPRDSAWETARSNGTALRVISLNCQSKISAVEELATLNPDVILTQESPGVQGFEQLLKSPAFENYQLVHSVDSAMLVRGTVTAVPVPRSLTSQYVLAEVTLKSGAKFNLASTRLIPVPLRFDVWNPQAWQSYADNRQQRRQQLNAVFQQLTPMLKDASRPMILGGDFNAVAHDAIFEILKPKLRDAWPEAGRGWGKTIENNIPVQRIDAVWISSHFSAESVTAKKSEHSDHRMVICDLWLK